MDSPLFTAAEVALLKINILDLDDEAYMLAYSLSTEKDKVAKLQKDLKVISKRSRQNKRTAMDINQADHVIEMNYARDEHADIAFHLINAYVEKELIAAGALDRLAFFKANREQRRMDIEKSFGCHKNNDDEEKLEVAVKRRRKYQVKKDQDNEYNERRSDRMQKKWAKRMKKYLEKSRLNQIDRDRCEQIVADEQRLAQHSPNLVVEDEDERLDNCETPASPDTDTEPAMIVNEEIDAQHQPLSPIPMRQPETQEEKERKKRLAEEYEKICWEVHYEYQLDTEADEEIDIPIYGDSLAEYREENSYRYLDPDREFVHPEQMVLVVLHPPQNQNQKTNNDLKI